VTINLPLKPVERKSYEEEPKMIIHGITIDPGSTLKVKKSVKKRFQGFTNSLQCSSIITGG